MRSPSTLQRPRGPFAVPARSLLLLGGFAAIGLGAFNLVHERHFGEVDNLYVGVAGAVGAAWLVSLILAFRGLKLAVAISGAIAFVEFGLISSSHFVTGPGAMSGYVKKEGLLLAPALMALMVLCILTFMMAVVSWSHPTGHLRRVRLLPLLLSCVVGATLVILYATDSVARDDFGTANPEDGTFAASVSATFWLFGGLWIARVRKTGALLIGLGTFMASFSFTALHLLKGGQTLPQIVTKSGPAWATIDVAMAGLAFPSLVLAVALLVAGLLRQRRTNTQATAPGAIRRSGT